MEISVDEQYQQDDEDVYVSSSPPSSTQTSTLTWITWFTSLPGHEYFCEVAEDFIEDDFNLTGLQTMVPFWKEALEMVLDVEPEEEDSLKIPDVSIIESSAELLYGLVHQRYILTRQGLTSMAAKPFGACPRVFCNSTNVVPCGRSDQPGLDTVKLYCPNCGDIYAPPSSRFQGVDGAFFGTTFPHLFYQTYRDLFPGNFYPPPPAHLENAYQSQIAAALGPYVNPDPHGGVKRPFGQVYQKRIYGFKVSERARSGPRMEWLRMRPAGAEELDKVDWKGRWVSGGGGDDGEDGEGGEGGGERGELFEGAEDSGTDEEEEEEEEEEQEDGPPPAAGADPKEGNQAALSTSYPPTAMYPSRADQAHLLSLLPPRTPTHLRKKRTRPYPREAQYYCPQLLTESERDAASFPSSEEGESTELDSGLRTPVDEADDDEVTTYPSFLLARKRARDELRLRVLGEGGGSSAAEEPLAKGKTVFRSQLPLLTAKGVSSLGGLELGVVGGLLV